MEEALRTQPDIKTSHGGHAGSRHLYAQAIWAPHTQNERGNMARGQNSGLSCKHLKARLEAPCQWITRCIS